GALAGVDHDHALRVLDREGVDRKRLGPVAVEERVQQPAPAMSDTLSPRGCDRDGACLDCVDLDHRCSFGLVDLEGVASSGANPLTRFGISRPGNAARYSSTASPISMSRSARVEPVSGTRISSLTKAPIAAVTSWSFDG